MKHETPTRWLRALAGAAIILLVVRSLQRHASDVSLRPILWHLNPLALMAMVVMLLLSFGCLILSWWAVARGWRQGVSLKSAARVWALTNRIRYLPSHGASIEQMAELAANAGVSRPFAVGAAVLPRMISLSAAAAVAGGLYVLNRMDANVISVLLGCLIVAASLAAAVLLTSSDVCFRMSVAIHRPNSIRPVEPDALGGATLLDIAGFLLQGAALLFLADGLMSGSGLTWWVATGSFAAAYVVGRLLPVLPSGILVREAVLIVLLGGATGSGTAVVVTILWRGVLTLADLAAAMPFQRNTEQTT